VIQSVLGVGLLAWSVITLLMYLARGMGLVMLDLPLLLGTFLWPPGLKARFLGLIPHTLLSVGLIPLGYWAVFRRFELTVGLGGGLLLGVLHWLASAVGMLLIGRLNPRAVDQGPGEEAECHGQVLAPGPFGWRYGVLAPPAILVGHLIYGGIVGWWLGHHQQQIAHPQ
jgi:hypothetical protein